MRWVSHVEDHFLDAAVFPREELIEAPAVGVSHHRRWDEATVPRRQRWERGAAAEIASPRWRRRAPSFRLSLLHRGGPERKDLAAPILDVMTVGGPI